MLIRLLVLALVVLAIAPLTTMATPRRPTVTTEYGGSPGGASWARTPMHSVAKRKGWTDLAVTGDA